MKINKYFPFFVLYFFFNTVLLPIGLLYTTILTPAFYIFLKNRGKVFILLKFFLPLIPYFIIHFINGVDEINYLKSTILLFTVYVAVYAFYVLVKSVDYMPLWFKKVTVINFLLTLIGIIFFFTPPPYIYTFWTIQNLSMDVKEFPRLSLLTYEPSYYSTLLVPLIGYFLLDLLIRNKKASMGYLLLLLLPFVLSFSLGVMACLCFAFLFTTFIHNKAITIRRINLRPILYSIFFLLLSLGVWVVAVPNNPLAARVMNVIDGKDQSGKGRTSEAFLLAYRIADERSLTWGSGIGQIKILGEKIIRPYYNYQKDDIEVTTIPCAAAETLAIFGFVGLFIRIGLQIFLFFKTRVLDSSFRTLLFFHIFIYQFTGSFITNLAEYLIWTLAFVPCFIQFEKPKEQMIRGAIV